MLVLGQPTRRGPPPLSPLLGYTARPGVLEFPRVSMSRQFTPIGLRRLDARIAALERQRGAVLKAAGEAAGGDSNSYHDNFAYEQGMREQEILARRILELRQVRAAAFAVEAPRDARTAQLGHVVTVRFDGGEPTEFFLCGDGEATFFAAGCSAHTPLGEALVGRAVGAAVRVRAGKRERTVEVVAVRLPVEDDPALAAAVEEE